MGTEYNQKDENYIHIESNENEIEKLRRSSLLVENKGDQYVY